MTADWDKVESHKKFIASDDYAPMLKRFEGLLSGSPALIHFEYASAGAQRIAFGAPVTEHVTLFFSEKDESKDEKIVKLGEALMNHATPSPLAVVGGWSVEEVEHEKLEGKKGKAYRVALGWNSIEEHMACRNTDAFKNNIGLLRENAKGVDVVHVVMQQD